MSPNRPSRWIAPLALLAAVGAVLFVVSGSTGDGESENDEPTTQERREARPDGEEEQARTETTRTSTTPRRRTYTVRPGDTLALISERTGVSVEELQELNPDIDPNSLTVGDKIKLTE